jgi:hypothetical protein
MDKREPNLFTLPFNSLEYGLECAIGKATLLASLLVILISCAHSLWSKVEGISEGLVDASQNISTGHEDLSYNVSHCSGQLENYARLALSKAVLHALGCVATKIGLVDIVSGVRNVTLVIDLEQSIFQVELGVIQGN